jgi:sirohydrochlorin ferrochelatase
MAVKNGVRSPASVKMDEAIEAVLEEKPIVPDKSSFIDANVPSTDREIRQAAERGYSAVVVSPDGSMRIVSPEQVLGADAA